MKYRESEETYLETILILSQKLGVVRSIDIATELNYSRPSVSRAVNLLAKNGYILIGSKGDITFTNEGRLKAESVNQRHKIITGVFIKMGADKNLAEENACRIEHVVSDELISVLKNFLEK